MQTRNYVTPKKVKSYIKNDNNSTITFNHNNKIQSVYVPYFIEGTELFGAGTLIDGFSSININGVSWHPAFNGDKISSISSENWVYTFFYNVDIIEKVELSDSTGIVYVTINFNYNDLLRLREITIDQNTDAAPFPILTKNIEYIYSEADKVIGNIIDNKNVLYEFSDDGILKYNDWYISYQ